MGVDFPDNWTTGCIWGGRDCDFKPRTVCQKFQALERSESIPAGDIIHKAARLCRGWRGSGRAPGSFRFLLGSLDCLY
jgi:hypothetical protein